MSRAKLPKSLMERSPPAWPIINVPIWEWALAAVGFFLFARWYCLPAFDSGISVAAPGDGWGTIGWMYDMTSALTERGWTSLFGGTFQPQGIGPGFDPLGLPSGFFWRSIHSIFGIFLKPDDVYDMIACISVGLIGLAGYLLGRQLGISWTLSILCGFLLTSLDHFNFRLVGHLGLAVYFMPIFLVRSSIKFLFQPTRSVFLTLVFLSWLNFIVNEYYGYFGFYIVFLSLVMARIYRKDQPLFKPKQILQCIGLSLVMFLLLMVLSYPELFKPLWLRLSGGQGGENVVSRYARSKHDFHIFSLANPMVLFQPRDPWLMKHFPKWIMDLQRPDEFTFRIGAIAPALMFGALLYLPMHEHFFFRRSDQDVRNLRRVLGVLACFSVLGVCLALRPSKALSLVPITMAFAPVFRVSQRALLYTDIAIISGFCVALSLLGIWIRRMWLINGYFRIGAVAVSVLSTFVAFRAVVDIRQGFPTMSRVPIFLLPEFNEFKAIANLENGLLLELPYTAPPSPPEDEYIYYLGRTAHHKPILNGGLPYQGATGETLKVMKNLLEPDKGEIGSNIINLWRRIGIRYVAIHEPKNYPIISESFNEIEVLVKTDQMMILKVMNSGPFDREFLRALVFPLPGE